MDKKAKIWILGQNHETCVMLYNSVQQYATVEKVILEDSVSAMTMISKRVQKLGLGAVFGQLLFLILVKPFLKLTSRNRVKAILNRYNLSRKPIPTAIQSKVNSVNNDQCKNMLSAGDYDLLVVAGTRIIASSILDIVQSKIVNIHVGITPNYRGVHGGYWSLYNNDKENFGVTLHYVNAGIDTGEIISQKRMETTKKDNYITYPYLQNAEGLKLLKKYISGHTEENVPKLDDVAKSKLYSHPKIWQYLRACFMRGIK